MQLGEPANKKATRNVRLVLGGLALLFILAFFREIGGAFSLFWTLIKVIILRFPYDGLGEKVMSSVGIVFFNLFIGFAGVAFLWMLLISAQALLPVNNPLEIYRTAWRFWRFITRRHGPAMFVKDGALVSTQEDTQHKGYGVIVVDFNSAVVLEEQDEPPGCSQIMARSELNFFHTIGLCDARTVSRVCGPGIVFTNPNEQVRGAVDLRKQFRLQPKVTSYTREGIELTANVLAMFTVGMDPEPDALQITFYGDRLPGNVRVCSFVPEKGRGGKYLKLTALSDELELDDCQEITTFAEALERTGNFLPYQPLPRHPVTPVYNQKRAFSAVFAQARSPEKDVLAWTELPTRVAASFYREIMPTINYDELYAIRENGKFPLFDYKAKLRLRMRNNGMLAYRLVYHINGEQLMVGKVYHESQLSVSEVRQLTTSKLLRDRGIKINGSSFGDPAPVSQQIYQQRLDSWRSTWEKELDIARAGRELQAMRVRGRAMTEAQRDLWYGLNQIFSSREVTDEVLALRVMQALETAAADPKTHDLLPATTIEVLRQINNLLVPPQVSMNDYPFLPREGE